MTDAELVKRLQDVNARQADRVDQLQNTVSSMQRRINRLERELRELRAEDEDAGP